MVIARVVIARVVIAAAGLTIAACSGGTADVASTTSMSPLSEPSGDVSDSALAPDDPAVQPEIDAQDISGQQPVVSDPPAQSPVTPPDPAVLPAGFTTALVEITEADGTVCEVCMWLADTADERGRGLMDVTSLGTPEGMAFVWEEPTAGSFLMFQTVTSLSIAWFAAPSDDSGGPLVSTADMEPCLSENSAECERFSAGGDYVLAIEVFQGDLATIGITEGARARLLPDTEATDCPRT